jgi:hypothetical protein
MRGYALVALTLCVNLCTALPQAGGAEGVHAATFWQPPPRTTWYWQLQGTVPVTEPAQVYDIDGFNTVTATVGTLHAASVKVVCYMDAGTYESWRPDRYKFPNSVKGETVSGFANERWLDIRQTAILLPIMKARAGICRSRGFDAIEWDNIDGYSNDTGFNRSDNPSSYITPQDQITYDTDLAQIAHQLGLSVAFKNDVNQAGQLASHFDFAIDEQCFEYNECNLDINAFIAHNKAVFEVEYNPVAEPFPTFCPAANAGGLSSAFADVNLDGRLWETCWTQ